MRNLMLTALGSFLLFSSPGAALPDDPAGARTFELEEGLASDFDHRDSSLVRGAYAYAGEERPAGLLGVPAFVSEKPRFGVFPLGDRQGPSTGGRNLYFALDEKKGTGTGHNRIYYDLDEDGDLSDETAHLISKTFVLEFDLGEGFGLRPITLKGKAHSLSDGRSLLYLHAPGVRHGKVEIGGEEFEVVLSQGSSLTGRFDLPHGLMVLSRVSSGRAADGKLPAGVIRPGETVVISGETVVRSADGQSFTFSGPMVPRAWSGANRLDSVRIVGGKHYTFSATPDGSRFTVTPYEGELGVFRVGPGGREVVERTASGSLMGDRSVPVGEHREGLSPDPAAECLLPVGDYRPNRMTVRYDSLTIDTSFNSYVEGKPGEPSTLGIEIREDRPFVFDFSNKPEILFTQPVELQRFERGATVRIEALLTDPALGLMIRDIERWQGGREPGGWSDPVSLDPRVKVVDSAGEVRAFGQLPFG